jgi:hypothetical protein
MLLEIDSLQIISMAAVPDESIRDGGPVIHLLRLCNYSPLAMNCLRISTNFAPWEHVRLSDSNLYRRMLLRYSEQYDWELNIELEHIFYLLQLRYFGKLK